MAKELIPANQRFKSIRAMINISRADMEKLFDIPTERLNSLENNRTRVTQVELQSIAVHLPELIPYLVYNAPIDFKLLKKNRTQFAKMIVDRIISNELPAGFDLDNCIINRPK